jgi:hypothetical protein
LAKPETKTKAIPKELVKKGLTHKKMQSRPMRSSVGKIPQLHRVKSFNELKEVIAMRSQHYPTNYMDLLLLDNRDQRLKLSEILGKFRRYTETLDNNDFKTVSILKKHIRYRENHDGWIFDHSGDPQDPIVTLVNLAK